MAPVGPRRQPFTLAGSGRRRPDARQAEGGPRPMAPTPSGARRSIAVDNLRLWDDCRRQSTTFAGTRGVMSKKAPYKNRIELLQGTLDMLILQTLQWGPQHGHGIG